MNDVQLFKSDEFGQVRVIMQEDEPWFVAADVCKALELTNPTMAIDRLESDERAKLNLGRQGETNVLNEYGLYSLVLGSRKPEARQFKRWITHEVIPSIRKHGAYMTPETIKDVLTKPDFIIQLATELKKEQEARKAAEEKIALDAPKVAFANAVTGSPDSILVRDLAKILCQNGYDTGEKRLYKTLREMGFLIKKKGKDYNHPTQFAMDRGLFELKETTIENKDGSILTKFTTMVTGKGQEYFVNKFKEWIGIEDEDNQD